MYNNGFTPFPVSSLHLAIGGGGVLIIREKLQGVR